MSLHTEEYKTKFNVLFQALLNSRIYIHINSRIYIFHDSFPSNRDKIHKLLRLIINSTFEKPQDCFSVC